MLSYKRLTTVRRYPWLCLLLGSPRVLKMLTNYLLTVTTGPPALLSRHSISNSEVSFVASHNIMLAHPLGVMACQEDLVVWRNLLDVASLPHGRRLVKESDSMADCQSHGMSLTNLIGGMSAENRP
jgi:hypothetical protein